MTTTNQQPTPETDATMKWCPQCPVLNDCDGNVVPADFARKLERERDAARDKAAAFEQATQDERNIHMTTIAERDQLRKNRDKWKESWTVDTARLRSKIDHLRKELSEAYRANTSL